MMKVKNSNKVLLLILFLSLSIPLLVAMVLRHQVRTGTTVLIDRTNSKDPALRQQGRLTGVKVIKVKGPLSRGIGSLSLHALIRRNGRNTYALNWTHRKDSVMIRQMGDTLFFSYTPKNVGGMNHRYFQPLDLTLNLPDNIPVIAENCTLGLAAGAMDPIYPQSDVPAAVYLRDGAVLEIGSPDRAREDNLNSHPGASAAALPDSAKTGENSFDTAFVPLTDIRIFADSSTVKFLQPVRIHKLHLQLHHASTLEMPYAFTVEKLTGTLDPDTQLKGRLGSLLKVQPIAAK